MMLVAAAAAGVTPAKRWPDTDGKHNGGFRYYDGLQLNTVANYRVVQKNGATLHFPKYLENY